MTTKIDEHLSTLGLVRGASVSEILLVFRKLAFKYHPDRAGGSEVEFKRMKAAYEWLDANYEKELALEQRSVKKEEPVLWSSFSDKPNPNIGRHASQQSNVRKPYVYPSNIPKWNGDGATTLDNDWEVAKYEQSGELDRQMVGNFSDWNKPSPSKKDDANKKNEKSDFWSNYKT